jgi:hypothetical protein
MHAITIGRHPKYLIFIHPCLPLLNGYYNHLYKKKKTYKILVITNRKNKLEKLFTSNRKEKARKS